MSTSCQVDFYLLSSQQLDAQQLCCKLALMAWERGHKISIVTDGPESAKSLDKLMWQYPEGRFLPHQRTPSGQEAVAPVSILETPPEGELDVVINLTTKALPTPLLCSRLLEIVPFRDAERVASREKFKHYRAAGLNPKAHTIN